MGIDHSTVILRRRVAAKLRPLANFFSLGPVESIVTDDDLVNVLETLLEQATDAAVRDEVTLASWITSIDQRFDAAWPHDDKVESLMRRVHGELLEVRQAIADAEKRPDLRSHVVEELGDVMLLLSRIALVYGAKSSLEPLQVAVRKTFGRLARFESLRRAPATPGTTHAELWSLAKRIAG
jgi:NTP pyrophosphatase (non-canonical NTP hydrolase)